MDGLFVFFDKICDLVEKYDVLVMIDECYVVGFIGEIGRGIFEEKGVMGWIDIIIGIFGKVFGGVMGGYIIVKKEIIEMLRQ